MSIFSRIFKIGQAKANQIVDGLEKPEVMLDQAIRDKAKQIAEAKRALQGCIATERQTKSVLNKHREEKEMWERKAELAVGAGKDELAVKALTRSEEAGKLADSLEPSWKTQKASIDKIKADIHRMESELAEIKRNKDVIIAQSKVADVKKQIHQARAKCAKKSNGADDLLERMKAKAQRSMHEADAAEEMADSFDGEDSLEKEFEELGAATGSASVQDKLAALKNKMNKDA
jgi:phage shock protein A